MTTPEAPGHVPVLAREVVDLLDPRAGETYVDCTAGLGGHAALIAPRLSPGGRVFLTDVDPANLNAAAARVRAAAPGVEVGTLQVNFAVLPHELAARGVRADLVLADLGFASTQVDDPARGLSFMREGPLDMRLDPTLPVSAAELVNSLAESELVRILEEFGEERQARRVARAMVAARAKSPLRTTTELAEVVRRVVPRSGPTDPATRTFQALRIAVNDELGNLEALLAAVERDGRSGSAGWLSGEARVGVISFHSLEDRAVKEAFGRCTDGGWDEVSHGVVMAGEGEREANPRARSAKLRVVRRAGAPK
ncbi:MAG: 16S rRNA (cytosine(1402)-N(4))-methyltransferase RsmH [Planctomycetota bacterium]|nr:16S rRNA (cytosine(1402)-N(4))-methyltransferase RsmH [Planctomycetota bacterium]